MTLTKTSRRFVRIGSQLHRVIGVRSDNKLVLQSVKVDKDPCWVNRIQDSGKGHYEVK